MKTISIQSASMAAIQLFACVSLVTTAHSVQAQNTSPTGAKPRAAAKPAKPEKSAVSQELKQECVTTEYDLAQREQANRVAIAKHNESANAFNLETEAIKKQRDALDRTNQAALDAFNLRVDTYKTTGAALEKSGENLLDAEQKYKADVANFNRRCVGIAVLPGERDTILKAHAAKNSKP
jgi:hypothetical protein